MRKLISLSVLLLSSVLLTSCYSTSAVSGGKFSEKDREKRLKIAVVDFENKSDNSAYDGLMKGMTGTMVDELRKTRSFRIIERQRLDSVLTELKMGMSGLVNPDTAKQVGKQLGVDAILFGDLSSVKYSKNKQTIFVMWSEGQRTDVTVDARLVDTETGEVIASAKAPAFVKERRWVAFGFARLGRVSDEASVIQTGVELACRQLAIDLASEMR